MTNLGDRIIVLIDMDCFFCQVESRLQPHLQGKPVAVVQYNQWTSGGIIAVNYEARDFGVTRHMRRAEAKEKCPDIVLVSVPSVRGKADTSKYRSAGREVVEVLKKRCSIIERASVDEAYLDITELVEQKMASVTCDKSLISNLGSTFVVGYCDDESYDEEQRRDGIERWINETFNELGDEQSKKLVIAGNIVEELRAEIYEVTKFRCSAGISYNKILAKLACGLHKPNRQTVLPNAAVPSLYSKLPVKKVRNLGGKFGNIVMESLGCNVMADLMRYTLQDLQKRFDEKTGHWLFNIARGIDNEPVTTRLVCKSIGASKNFPGKQAIVKLEVLKHWVTELSIDVSERLEQDLEENQRRATTLTVGFHYYEDRKVITQSRSCPLKSYKAERIASQSIDLITKSTQKPIANVSIAATKFLQAKGSGNFVNFFKNTIAANSSDSPSSPASLGKEMSSKPNETYPEPDNNAAIDTECINGDNTNPCETKNQKESLEKPREAVESFFAKQLPNRKENSETAEPISPSTAILGSAQLKKALNHENLKNSFFMNFLKDSKPDIANETPKLDSPLRSEEKPLSSLYSVNSVQSSVRENHCNVNEKRIENVDKPVEENILLAQLQEIFPDFDNIDRSVVQLLPMELQRLANSYLKAKTIQKPQVVKNHSKASKSKSAKAKISVSTPPANSFQNFFVKRDPKAVDESTLVNCSECSQMINVNKYSEHKDFHVAQDLQRIMNQSMAREVCNSANNGRTVENSFKRRLSDESPQPNKKAKSISSFFCT